VLEARTERVTIMMEKSLVERIEDYRFAARKGSRASAMRALMEAALSAQNENGPAATGIAPDLEHDLPR